MLLQGRLGVLLGSLERQGQKVPAFSRGEFFTRLQGDPLERHLKWCRRINPRLP